MPFHVPGLNERLVVAGKTGSGKTQGAAFILSQMEFDKIPFVIIDWKREAMFKEMPLLRTLHLSDPIPSSPGLYVIRPRPGDEEEVDEFLWAVLEKQNTGLFIDEGFMMGRSRAYEAILTQGRSLFIPVITVTQRPAFVSLFAFSEADYFMIFRLVKKKDRERINEDAPIIPVDKVLPKYHSWWYDVNEDQLMQLRPVPGREWILRRINQRLAGLASQGLTRAI